MGNAQDSQKGGEVAEKLLGSTHFSKEEVAELMLEFKKISPNLRPVSMKKFGPLCQLMGSRYPNPAYTNAAYTKIIFAYSDRDGDKKVDVAEAISTLSIMTRGSIEEKAELIFGTFDKNGDSYISRDELRTGFEATFSHMAEIQANCESEELLATVDFLKLFHEKQRGISHLVDRFFEEIDTDGDGLISKEEFTIAAKTSQIMCILLQPGSPESHAYLYSLSAQTPSTPR